MPLIKYHLEYFDIEREKIKKFADLFPNGTEVTYDLCVKHPDVFSFGLQGIPLVPYAYKSYVKEIGEITHNYYSKINEIKQIHGKKWIGPYTNIEQSKNQNAEIFTWGPIMPANRLRPLTANEINILNENLQDAKNYYCLQQSIAFYNAKEENRRVTTRTHP